MRPLKHQPDTFMTVALVVAGTISDTLLAAGEMMGWWGALLRRQARQMPPSPHQGNTPKRPSTSFSRRVV